MNTISCSEMKCSGLEWIGMIPRTWDVVRVKRILAISRGDVIAKSEIDQEEKEGFYPVYSSQTQNDGCMGYIPSYSVDGDGLTWTTDGANAGTVFLRKGKYNCTNVCGLLRPKNGNVSLPYLLYSVGLSAFYSRREDINGYKIMSNEMADIKIVIPPLAEQEAIAAYLDEKCAAIDEIIAEAKATIEEYKAWKSSVIFEAVTKGLDPNAEMKDSGIPWIGKIPKNWNVIQLKRLCEKITDGSHFSPDTTDDGLPYVTAADVDGKGLDYQRAHKIRKEDFEKLELAGCRPFAGDVLLVKDGATTGRVGLMTDNEPCVILSSVAILRPSDMVSSLYLMYLLKSEVLQFQIRRSMAGSAMPRATLSKLNKYITVACPPEEQDAIVTYLDKQCAVIDGIIAEKQALIDDLETYKKSLIFETVTGKRSVC